MEEIIPIVAILFFIYFFKHNHINNILIGLIFVSYLFFATNYSNYGLDISIFRYLHRFIGILVAVALAVHIYRYKVNIFKERVFVVFILFFLVLLLSFLGNDIYLKQYIHYVRNFVFIASIVLYLYCSLDSNEKLKELFKLIEAITILIAVFVVLEILQNGWGVGRIELFYSNANYLGYALLPGLVLAIFSKRKYKNLIVPLIIFSIFATGSRAAELSAVFAVSMFLLFNFKQLNKKYLTASFLIVTLTTIIFFDKIIINQTSDGIRTAIAKISFNVFNENPINGIGYGQFKVHYYLYIDEDIIELNNNWFNNALKSYKYSITDKKFQPEVSARGMELMTHNDLLTIATELGLVGLAFVVFLFHKLYFELKKLLLYSRNNYFISISLIGSSLIFSLFHNNLTSFMFWFVLIVPIIMNRSYKKID